MADQRILNLADVELEESPVPLSPDLERKFGGARRGFIGTKLGAKKLGYNLTAVPPGRRAFPLHSHRVNEEMFFVLQGTGIVRLGSESFPVRVGDVIACPPGGPETAHQIVNTGDEELRYLAVSTRLSPEIAEYPESNKFGVLAEFADGESGRQIFRYLGRPQESLGYFDGEPLDEDG
jgi:uncharacterized cupin superfamily protein